MRDILFALIGLALFAAFCTVLIVYVPQTDLVIVIVAVLLMTTFDFFRDLILNRNGKDDG